ncbi:unnamed protein product [Protopolystoma xenopodis]|uniref:Uncharacterized protein n=1 Tax=Protopolystoma xenopodis TaxID=117903 RepID=A0A3S5C6W4_9PLAT|nr:unnamed protein product [Protopolystoma xenopodis]
MHQTFQSLCQRSYYTFLVCASRLARSVSRRRSHRPGRLVQPRPIPSARVILPSRPRVSVTAGSADQPSPMRQETASPVASTHLVCSSGKCEQAGRRHLVSVARSPNRPRSGQPTSRPANP